MNIIVRCFLVITLFFHLNCNGQYYNLGQNPPSTHWLQIKSENFQVIFPSNFKNEAQKLANILTYANEKTRINLNTKPKKISILLQNNTTVDNGFVTLAPKRSEFYATPSQLNEGADWLKKLAVHEYRHVIQIEKFNQGIGKALYLMLGEQGMGALLLATTPLWFMEGDAVVCETNFTEKGRGNYGPFLKYLKAQISELDSISYEKASFGSFKTFITDHYKLGYFLNEYVNETYGPTTWDSLLQCVVKNPFIPYPFSYHLKQITGKNMNQIYGDMHQYLKNKWSSNNQNFNVKVLSPISKSYASFNLPLVINDSSMLVTRKSFNEPLKVAVLNNGQLENIHTPSRLDESGWDCENNIIVWAEKRRNPRWQYVDYSEIILFNLNTKKKKRLKRKTRWFYPQFSPSGDSVSIIDVDYENTFRILNVNLEGDILDTIYQSDRQIYHPTWEGHSKLIFIELIDGFSVLRQIDLVANTTKTLIQSPHPLNFIQPFQDGYLAQSSVNGKDKIVFIKNSKMFEVYNPQFGLNFPTVKNDQIIFADYHASGYKIVKTDFMIGNPIPLDKDWNENVFLDIPSDTFAVKKYHPLLNLFNIHSWAPMSVYPNEEDVNLGLSVFSQNLLSSSFATYNLNYNAFTNGINHEINYELARYYPVFYTNYSKSNEPNSRVQNVKTNITGQSFYIGTQIRQYYDGSKWRKSFSSQFSYGMNETRYQFETTFKDTLQVLHNTQWAIAWSTNHKRAQNDIYAPWSLTVTSIGFNNLNSSQNAIAFKVSGTAKGILKNDGVYWKYGRQFSSDDYTPTYLEQPRGVLNTIYKNAENLTIQYELPLVYPDLKMGPILYLQRIRLNGFYDYINLESFSDFKDYYSIGGTIFFDFNPFRYSYLSTFSLEIGVNQSNQYFFNPGFRINY